MGGVDVFLRALDLFTFEGFGSRLPAFDPRRAREL